MTKTPDSLDKVLDDLQAELTRLRSFDSGSEEQIDALAAKVEELRKTPGGVTSSADGGEQAVGGFFTDTLRSFEASHPHAAEAIERIMLLLSSIGI